MIAQKDINLIHKYLEDDLTQDEIALFKENFERNPEFAAEVRKYTDVKLSLRAAFRLQLESDKDGKTIELTGIGDADAINSGSRASIHQKSGSWRKIAIAASIVLLFGIGSILIWQTAREPLHQKLYAAYYVNPLEAEREFLSRSETYREDAEALEKFTRAIEYMEQQKFKAATEMLESITYARDRRLLDEVEWYLALCYLRTGKREKAIDLFVQILNSQSVHNAAARNIYNELTER